MSSSPSSLSFLLLPWPRLGHLQLAISALQAVLSEDFKATEVEVREHGAPVPLGAPTLKPLDSSGCCDEGQQGCPLCCPLMSAVVMPSWHDANDQFCPLLLDCLQTLKSCALMSMALQVGVVGLQGQAAFRGLTTEEIEQHLTAISERD
jgi:hypothetical protein